MIKKEDRTSILIEKIKEDIAGIGSVNNLSEDQICFSRKHLLERTSSIVQLPMRVEGVIPFVEKEEKEFFNLYACMRHKVVLSLSDESFESNFENLYQIKTILICQHMPIVGSWLKTNAGRTSANRHLMSQDEKRSEGHCILIRCIDKFSCSHGVKFCSYVYTSLNNMVLKDVRDNKKRRLETGYENIEVKVIPKVILNDAPTLVEIKEIWNDCANGHSAASFLTPIERAIVQADFSELNTDLDQEQKAKSLNINVETFRKKKKNALQKIREAIMSRLRRD